MFLIVDGVGLHQPYVPEQSSVGIRPEGVRRIAAESPVSRRTREPAPQAPPSRLAFRPPEPRTEPRPQLNVAAIMSKPVITILMSDTAHAGWHLLERSRVRHLPVIDEGRCVRGLLSQRDLLRLRALGENLATLTVQRAMTRAVLIATPGALVRDAARVMLEASVGSLPVVDEGGIPLGIVTRSDILRAVVKDAPLELWG